MTSKKDFYIGDLVWAKMKGFPFWPAKIVEPPTDAKSTPKKTRQYVFFFGSQNYAWIQDEHIVHHSVKMLQSTSSKKKSNILKLAIKQIAEEASKKARHLVKEKESTVMSTEVSTSNTEKKIAKVQRKKEKAERKKEKAERKQEKAESHKLQKKVARKRRAMDESESQTTSPEKLSKRPTEDFSELINNTPPNLNYKRIAVIRPLDEQQSSPNTTTAGTSTGITKLGYFELQQIPPFSLLLSTEEVRARDVNPTPDKIGFIGLGLMGQRMVRNLLSTKHRISVWNQTRSKCLAYERVGARIADSPRDLVETCDLIFCCVSGPEASKNLVFGENGILKGFEHSEPGKKAYVEMTTLDPTTSIDIGEAIAKKGGRYLEAPFVGTRTSAEDGRLLFLTAGDPQAFVDCQSSFKALSKNIYYVGDEVGSASKLNLIHRMFMGVASAALAESMALVERCNLPLINFLEIVELGPVNSPLLLEKGEAIMSRCFLTNSTLKYQQRDMAYALTLDNDRGQPMSVSTAANEVFKRAKLRNYSEHDVSAVFMGALY